MGRIFRVYCDESCHSETNQSPVMIIGGIKVPKERARGVADKIKEIKRAHGLPDLLEIKWTNASPAKEDLYLDLAKYFFETSDLKFRAIVAQKEGLDHVAFDQTHGDWFFKIYFLTLREILKSKDESYEIFIDHVDTRAPRRANKLQTVLNNYLARPAVARIQVIDSKDSQIMQVADILVGALAYSHRGLNRSSTKSKVVSYIESQIGQPLNQNSPLSKTKFNIFHWTAGYKK